MNSSNTVPMIRHLAAMIGTALITVPNPYCQAAGLLLSGFATWHLATNPSLPALQVPTVSVQSSMPVSDVKVEGAVVLPASTSSKSGRASLVILGILTVIALVSTLLFSGCATTASPSNNDLIASITTPVTETLVLPILQRNPKIEPALLAIADGIEGVFNGKAVSTADIQAFVASIAARYPELTVNDQLLISVTINNLSTLYATQTGGVLQTSDSSAKAFLTAFETGIKNGVALYDATKAPTP